MPEPTVAYRICPLCEACCGLTVELREGRVAAVRGDPEDVFSAALKRAVQSYDEPSSATTSRGGFW